MKPILIIIDMQHEFLGSGDDVLVADIAEFATKWVHRQLPVLVTQFRNAPQSSFVKFLGWAGAMQNTLVESLIELASNNIEEFHSVTKQTYSALTDHGVLAMLDEYGIDTVVLCGVDTDACIMAIALDAFDHGLRPLVLSDLCASSGGDNYHQAALMLLERNIGRRQLSTSKVFMDEVGNVVGAQP